MTSIHEQDKKKGGRPPTGRVRKLSKSVTVKFSKPSYEAEGEKSQPQVGGVYTRVDIERRG